MIDLPSINNGKIGGDESEKARCRAVDVPPFTP